MESRAQHFHDPFSHAMEIANSLNKPMSKYIASIKEGSDFALTEMQSIKEFVSGNSGTKFQTYVQLNPDFTTHLLYSRSAPVIPDYLRITFSRYRLSSHRLRVELGRYQGTPHDQRVCPCGMGVQDELHIFACPRVEDLLKTPNKTYNSPNDFFTDTKVEDLHVLHNVLKKLEYNE